MKMKLYGAYGSNMNLEQMACRCPAARRVGPALLEGYRLVFRGANNSAVATVEPFAHGTVPVLLWAIGPDDEAALDRYEGYPRLYRKELLDVRVKSRYVRAMAYVMNSGRPLGSPGGLYLGAIAEGYKDAGFDEGILNDAAIFSTGDERNDRKGC